jgi:hypothetical protein
VKVSGFRGPRSVGGIRGVGGLRGVCISLGVLEDKYSFLKKESHPHLPGFSNDCSLPLCFRGGRVRVSPPPPSLCCGRLVSSAARCVHLVWPILPNVSPRTCMDFGRFFLSNPLSPPVAPLEFCERKVSVMYIAMYRQQSPAER